MSGASVIILGSGLTGLSAAVALKRRGCRVTLLESAARPGGAVQTEHSDGFLVEHGPNSMMVDDPAIAAFFHDAGLEGEMVGPQAKKRYLVRKGRPVALPAGPGGALATPLFSLRGKLRVLGEPFVPRGTHDDESLARMVRRRLGGEVLDYAVEPFVAGIYAGDPARLSAKHAFPKLWRLERDHGSFVRGAMRRARGGPRPTMLSFRGGMGVLPEKLGASLGDDLRRHVRVGAIGRSGEGWSVEWDEQGRRKRATATTLVCAIPAFAVANLPWPEDLRGQLGLFGRIEYTPVSVLALGFHRTEVAHPLDGFGMLVPAAEKRRILGTIFSSSLFPGRAPDGCVLLTTFVGGARQPDLAALADDELERVACDDLRVLLGVRGEAVFRRIVRWPRAIPQYNLGYGEVLSALEKLEAAHSGLHFVGNYRGGIAAGQCIRNGLRLAEEIGACIPS
ncbi:MAG: protoporphyrinogen oxidase [Chthoniobacterales bacterium]|jgi:oxygen-dependent protoporphyrinogen oxidase